MVRIEWLGDRGVRWYLGPTSKGLLYVELTVSEKRVARRLVFYGKGGSREVISYEVYSPRDYAAVLEASRALLRGVLGGDTTARALIEGLIGALRVLEGMVGDGCEERS